MYILKLLNKNINDTFRMFYGIKGNEWSITKVKETNK